MTLHQTSLRVAIYLRVSTGRQAEADLSIPDQERETRAPCARKDWTVVATFVEPGASATDDRRPEFQRMIETATGADHPFDVILVHSMSRFFRDLVHSELYIRKLRKAHVEVVSATQTFENDPTGDMVRKIVGAFDEHQSRENAKHTLRSMRENARQGHWNGSVTPFGYATEACGQRGARIKKRLVVQDDEARVVRGIYDLALGRKGPVVGVKAIVTRLNADGIRFRGKPFHTSNVYRILTATTYHGIHHFNRRNTRSGEQKPREQWETMTVPAIVTLEDFEAVRLSLASRNPKKVPPRVVGSPTLLIGIARCTTCGSGMTLRTGKSGRYRYYTCAGHAQKGPTVCPGRSIAMEALDGMVLEHLADRLFTPDRLGKLLAAYVDRSEQSDGTRRRTLAQVRHRVTEIEGKISRVLAMVANGTMEPDDPQLRDMLGSLKAERASKAEEVKLLEKSARADDRAITAERVEQFAVLLRQSLANGDPAFRKAYLRLFVDIVVVGDTEIRISGPTGALAKAASEGALPDAATVVPSFVREWRGERNPRPTFAGEKN